MIIEPKPKNTGIIGVPSIKGMLSTSSRYYFGWEFRVGSKDILVTSMRWYNAAPYAVSRHIEIFDFPNGDLKVRTIVEASGNSWGNQNLDNKIVLKANKIYRILLKVPVDQDYFYGEVSKMNFSKEGIQFLSARYSDDMISVFETKVLSEFADFGYQIL